MENRERKEIESTSGGNLPEKKFRAGAICATVWQNNGQSKDGQPTKYRTISVQRGYKNKEGEWQNTTSFRVNDLPRLSVVLQNAYEYVVTTKYEGGSGSSEQVAI